MFGFFKSKSEVEKLQLKYKSLMGQWHKLSSINRKESDKIYAEAEKILNEIEMLNK